MGGETASEDSQTEFEAADGPEPAAARAPDPEPRTSRAGGGPAPDTLAAAEREELARLRRERAESRLSGIVAEAEAFAEAEQQAGRCTPAERPHLALDYARAALDDANLGAQHQARLDGDRLAISAAPGTHSDRVAAVKARQALRPAHKLREEVLPGTATLVPAARGADAEEAAAHAASVKAYADRVYGSARN